MTMQTPTVEKRPLIALVCRVELLGEALRGALEEVGDVRVFRAGLGDTEGLLRSLAPDAVVVDDEGEAEAALPFLAQSEAVLVQVSVRDGRLTVDGQRLEGADGEISPESVRNALVGRLMGKPSRV